MRKFNVSKHGRKQSRFFYSLWTNTDHLLFLSFIISRLEHLAKKKKTPIFWEQPRPASSTRLTVSTALFPKSFSRRAAPISWWVMAAGRYTSKVIRHCDNCLGHSWISQGYLRDIPGISRAYPIGYLIYIPFPPCIASPSITCFYPSTGDHLYW